MNDPTNNRAPNAAAVDLTVLLKDWGEGDSAAFDHLFLQVYQDLRGMARRAMRGEEHVATLVPTALVHEVYQRLFTCKLPSFENRDHFFRTVSLMMRQVLIHYARSRQRLKRGGASEQQAVEMDQVLILDEFRPLQAEGILAIDQALNKLHANDSFKAEVVTLRFIVGLNVNEVAQVLNVSPRTVKRAWQFSKQWLARELHHANLHS